MLLIFSSLNEGGTFCSLSGETFAGNYGTLSNDSNKSLIGLNITGDYGIISNTFSKDLVGQYSSSNYDIIFVGIEPLVGQDSTISCGITLSEITNALVGQDSNSNYGIISAELSRDLTGVSSNVLHKAIERYIYEMFMEFDAQLIYLAKFDEEERFYVEYD